MRPYRVARCVFLAGAALFAFSPSAPADDVQVNTATDTIDFGDSRHNFQMGDVVYYFADPLSNGGPHKLKV